MSVYTSSLSFGFLWGMRSVCPSVDSNKPNSRSSKGATVITDRVCTQLNVNENDKRLGLHGFEGRF